MLENLYTKIISLHLTEQKQEKKLEYGPVLAEYIPEMLKQYNSNYTINYTECLDRIEIEDGYEAYMQGLELYNQALVRKFNSNEPVEFL